jgi:hypothetical protein
VETPTVEPGAAPAKPLGTITVRRPVKTKTVTAYDPDDVNKSSTVEVLIGTPPPVASKPRKAKRGAVDKVVREPEDEVTFLFSF